MLLLFSQTNGMLCARRANSKNIGMCVAVEVMTVLLAVTRLTRLTKLTTLPIAVSSSAAAQEEARLLFPIASDIVTATTWHHHRYCQLLSDAYIVCVCVCVYPPAFRIVPFQAVARTGKLSTRKMGARIHVCEYTKKLFYRETKREKENRIRIKESELNEQTKKKMRKVLLNELGEYAEIRGRTLSEVKRMCDARFMLIRESYYVCTFNNISIKLTRTVRIFCRVNHVICTKFSIIFFHSSC